MKNLIHIQHILEDLNVSNLLTITPIEVYNNNEVSVKWSKNKTTKGLRHLQMKEKTVSEEYQDGNITVNPLINQYRKQ